MDHQVNKNIDPAIYLADLRFPRNYDCHGHVYTRIKHINLNAKFISPDRDTSWRVHCLDSKEVLLRITYSFKTRNMYVTTSFQKC